jgi:hypothetical protein
MTRCDARDEDVKNVNSDFEKLYLRRDFAVGGRHRRSDRRVLDLRRPP